MSWTPSDLPPLAGRVALVTGATSGVGLHAARALAQRGATVILACRNPAKTAAVVAALRQDLPRADLRPMLLDLADLDSVRAFARAFADHHIPAIDLLLLNAGIACGPYATSPQGFERTFATNHLGHWLLTGLLVKFLNVRPGARVVAVASLAHRVASAIRYDVIRGRNPAAYDQFLNYGMSKLANLWFVRELNRRLLAARSSAVAVAAHPGISKSSILDVHADQSFVLWLLRWSCSVFCQTAEKGAWPLLMAATDPHAKRDVYYGPTWLFETCGRPDANAQVSELVDDEEKAKELWRVSEEMCDFSYQF